VLSGYTSSHVSSVHDFDSITQHFFVHTPNIGVPENNGVTLPKPRMKDTQELVPPDNKHRSPFSDCPKYNGEFRNDAPQNLM
jgi:hypothetical protein